MIASGDDDFALLRALELRSALFVPLITLEPGDQLVLYTDGVIDTVGTAERFGEERLAQTLRDATGAADAVRRIEQALVAFAHGSQVDDTAVIAVERTPGEPAAGGSHAGGDGVRVARN